LRRFERAGGFWVDFAVRNGHVTGMTMEQKSRPDRQGGKAHKVVILTPKKGPTSVSLSAIRKVVREAHASASRKSK
jgi:hypothetical protein